MAKIGSGVPAGGNAARPAGQDPYSRIQAPLDRSESATGVSWFSAIREVAGPLSRSWFDSYPQMSLREHLESIAESDPLARLALDFFDEDGDHNVDLDEIQVVPDVLRGVSGLGEPRALPDSSITQSVLDYLASRSVSGYDVSVITAGGVLVDLEKPRSWFGPWQTEFGSRCFVRLEAYSGEDGKEWCYVHTNLVVATRKPLGLGRMMAEHVSIPRSVLSQLFVAETPFPSQMMNMGRNIAHEGVPENLWPRPVISVDEHILVTYPEGEADTAGNLRHQMYSFPLVLRAGFAVSSDAVDHLDALIPQIVGSCVDLATIAEDGFRNYRGPEFPASFDHVYGSESAYQEDQPFYNGLAPREGLSAAGYARWIPETLIGDLVIATQEALVEAHGSHDAARKRDLLDWIIYEGAGPGVASAINSVCYSYLMPAADFVQAEHLLNIAIDMDVMYESTNALANLGQLKHSTGDLEEAQEILRRAIDRFDRYAEAEASYHLGLVLLDSGDAAGAIQAFERGARGEGPSDFEQEYAEKCAQELEKLGYAQSSSTDSARYCHQCGQALAQGAKFCQSCGTKL